MVAEVGNDQLGKKFSKVNIVKIHFLPAIRSHSSSLASVSCGRFYRPPLSLSFTLTFSLFQLFSTSPPPAPEYNNPGHSYS